MQRHKIVNIGFKNVIISDRVVALVAPDSSPMKRLKELAKDQGRLIDATCGRRTRSIIITDSNHLILSSLQPETITQRLMDRKGK